MTYNIKSIHFSESVCISANHSEIVMYYLIAYIQFAFERSFHDYALSPKQIGEILENVYGFSIAEKSDEYIEIDVYDIWEEYCSAAELILSIEMFHNENLENELLKQFNYIIDSD